jgi:uncharacterized protein (DUF4415 family)
VALMRKTIVQIDREKPRVDRAKLEATTGADVYKAGKLVRRGRRGSDNPKRSIAIRLDADVLERLRATGPGWQTRINEVPRAQLDRSGR